MKAEKERKRERGGEREKERQRHRQTDGGNHFQHEMRHAVICSSFSFTVSENVNIVLCNLNHLFLAVTRESSS